MPRIPEYEAERPVETAASTMPDTTYPTYVGDALKQAGAEISQLSAHMLTRGRQKEDANAQLQFMEAEQAAKESSVRAEEENAADDGEGMTDSGVAAIAEHNDKILKSMPARLQEEYKVKFDILKREHALHLSGKQNQKSYDHWDTKTKEQTGNKSMEVLANPDNFDKAKKELYDFIDKQPVTPAQKKIMKQNVDNSLIDAKADGDRERDPEGFKRKIGGKGKERVSSSGATTSGGKINVKQQKRQFDFIMHEFKGDKTKHGGSSEAAAYAKLSKARTLEEAVDAGFDYERPKIRNTEVRLGFAREVLAGTASKSAMRARAYFEKQGFTKEQASGLVGVLIGESTRDLDPGSRNTQDAGGGSHGVGQWNNQGATPDKPGRADNMRAFTESAGDDESGVSGGIPRDEGPGAKTLEGHPDKEKDIGTKTLEGHPDKEKGITTKPATGRGGRRANFQHGQYGAPGENQMQVTSNKGVKFQINKHASNDILGFVNALEDAGAPVHRVGGYAMRQKVGAKGLSQHAYGTVIDVNQLGRDVVDPDFQKWADQNKGLLDKLGRQYNMLSGGNWNNPDFGHWEWVPPEDREGADFEDRGEYAGGTDPAYNGTSYEWRRQQLNKTDDFIRTRQNEEYTAAKTRTVQVGDDAITTYANRGYVDGVDEPSYDDFVKANKGDFDQADRAWEDYKDRKEAAILTHSFTNMTNDEIVAEVEKVKAAIPVGEGAEAATKVAGAVERAGSGIIKQRAAAERERERLIKRYEAAQKAAFNGRTKTPFEYTLKSNPAMQQAWTQALQGVGATATGPGVNPKGSSTAIETTYQAQKNLGVENHNMQLLPPEQVSALVGRLSDDDLDDNSKKAQLANIFEMTANDKYRRIIFRQLVDAGLPLAMQYPIEAYLRGDQGAYNGLFSAALAAKKDVKPMDGTKIKAISDLARAQVDSPLGHATFGTGLVSASSLQDTEAAVQLMTNFAIMQGGKPEQDVQNAANMIFGNKQVIEGTQRNGTTIEIGVDKSVNSDEMRKGFEETTKGLLLLAEKQFPGMEVDEVTRTKIKQTFNRSQWRNLDDGYALMLPDGTYFTNPETKEPYLWHTDDILNAASKASPMPAIGGRATIWEQNRKKLKKPEASSNAVMPQSDSEPVQQEVPVPQKPIEEDLEEEPEEEPEEESEVAPAPGEGLTVGEG